MRLNRSDSLEEVNRAWCCVLADDQISLTAIEPAKPSLASPLTQEITRAIGQAKEKLWPGIPIVAEMETGATDGLFFRQLGVPTYGITGIASDMDDSRMHGSDERVGVKDFYDGLEFEYQLIKAVASKGE